MAQTQRCGNTDFKQKRLRSPTTGSLTGTGTIIRHRATQKEKEIHLRFDSHGLLFYKTGFPTRPVNIPGALSMSVLKENQFLEIANDSGLKVILRRSRYNPAFIRHKEIDLSSTADNETRSWRNKGLGSLMTRLECMSTFTVTFLGSETFVCLCSRRRPRSQSDGCAE